MTKEVLKALDEKRGFHEETFARSEFIGDVLRRFKQGAARAFLDKLERFDALQFVKNRRGEDISSVFRLRPSAEERLRNELKPFTEP